MMMNGPGLRRYLLVSVIGLAMLVGCADPGDGEEAVPPNDATDSEAVTEGLAQRIEAYIAALNAGDAQQLFAFYEDGVTEGYRNRRSEEDDRAFYAMLTEDLGHVAIEDMRRESNTRVTVTARSDRQPVPVHFVFEIDDERIDGVSVTLGGSPRDPTAAPVVLAGGLDNDALSATLHEQLTALAARDEFSGTVLLARNGEVFFHESYGFADRAAGRRISASTALDIGSITKLITRTAVAQLLQQKEIVLDGRIIDYLPDYPNRRVAETVTVQQLLDHSSGLGDIFNARWHDADKQQYIEPRDFFALFADEQLRFEPGSRRSYSNAGFIVLGAIIEAVAGEPFEDYLENHIFRPAGMARSGLELRNGQNDSHAIGYASLGKEGALVPNLGMLPVKGCPAGSSMHTAADLLKLDRALRDGRLLNPEWTAWLFRSPDVLPDDGYAIGVAGGAPGVSAGLESNGAATAVVLSNFDPPGGESLARQLFAVISGQKDI